MNLKGDAALLSQALKELAVQWQETKAFWHDSQAAAFEETYIEALPPRVNRALAVMEELNTLLRKVHSDCE